MAKELPSKNNNGNKSGVSISRKEFLKKTTLSLCSLSSLPILNRFTGNIVKNNGEPDNQLLRTIAYNIYGCKGWARNDNKLIEKVRETEQISERMALELSLYNPGILNFSESPEKEVVAKIAEMLNMNFAYFRGGFSGSILSRYEIVDSKNKPYEDNNHADDLFTRHWGKAEIRLPNGKNITVHSAHLRPFRKSKRDIDIRLREISELLKSIKNDLSKNKSIILQGDLNHTPGTPEYKKLLEAGLIDTFAKVGKGDGATIKADKPSRRIDYVYAVGPIAKHIIKSRPLYEGDFRTNLDDPQSFALSDHLPQMAEFKI